MSKCQRHAGDTLDVYWVHPGCTLGVCWMRVGYVLNVCWMHAAAHVHMPVQGTSTGRGMDEGQRCWPISQCSVQQHAPSPPAEGVIIFVRGVGHPASCSPAPGLVQPSARSLCFPFSRLRAFHIPIDNVFGTFRH